MNIQSLGSVVSPKIDDRTVQAAEPFPPSKSGEPAKAEPSRERIASAVKQINESMQAKSQSLEFSIDDDSKQTVVKIIDQNTREVVRQIPSEEALEISKSLDKMMGLLISQKA